MFPGDRAGSVVVFFVAPWHPAPEAVVMVHDIGML
jgi:hypothetical protein